MNQGKHEGQFRKSKRNFSDHQPKFSRFRHLQEALQEQKLFKPKLNSIKINTNKLPPDFFPRSQSLRKKASSNRGSLSEQTNYVRQFHKKAASQSSHVSPEKTSFFGFFQESTKTKNNKNKNTLSLKRQFQSRDQPKRQKVYSEQRNLTPMTGIHRTGLLMLFPANYDQATCDALNFSKKKKEMLISPRKQHLYKFRQNQQQIVQLEDPQSNEQRKQIYKQGINMSTSGGSEDLHNITFFNAKSTSFPPIYKNNCSN